MGSLLSKNNNTPSEEQQVTAPPSTQTAPVAPGPGETGKTADDQQATDDVQQSPLVEPELVVPSAEEEKKTDETETKVNCPETSCEQPQPEPQPEAFDDTTFAALEEIKDVVQAAVVATEVAEEALKEEQVERGCDGGKEPEKIEEPVSNGQVECEQEQVEEVKNEDVPAEVQLSTSDLKVEVNDTAAAEADLMSQDDVTVMPSEQQVENGTVSVPEQPTLVDVEKTVDEMEAKTKDLDIGAAESPETETFSTEVAQQ